MASQEETVLELLRSAPKVARWLTTQLTAKQSATHTFTRPPAHTHTHSNSNLVSSNSNNNLTHIAASHCIRSALNADRWTEMMMMEMNRAIKSHHFLK